MIQNQKIIAILFSVLLALIPLRAAAQQETGKDSLNVDNSPVQVAFRTVEQKNLLGAVSVINVEDLMTKSYDLGIYEDALVGGLNNGIWGMGGALVVVDGIPRDQSNVLPTEIAQITYLKGAAL